MDVDLRLLVGVCKAKGRWLFGDRTDATSTLADKSKRGEIETRTFF